MPAGASILSGGGCVSCLLGVSSNLGTGGLTAAISVGASFSFVLLWLPIGG